MDSVLRWIGGAALVLTTYVIVAVGIAIPIEVGAWAMDRFGFRYPRGNTVVVRHDADAKPLWICADEVAGKHLNCLSRDELIELARQRWSARNHRQTAPRTLILTVK